MGEGMGKVDRDFLSRVLVRNLGARSKDVLVGPGMGLDNAVISIGRGKVMVVTADPISIIPSIGMDDSAWLTVHEIASDLLTSGVRPQFAVLDYNLPPSLDMDDFEIYVKAVGRECASLGIAIIGGHTGKYPGSDYSVVGGGMMMGIAGKSEYVTPAMVRRGDDIIMTKGSAIEATAVLSRAFPERVEKAVGTKAAKVARGYFRLCSTVEDATVAASAGLRSAVTSMHDATEGGVFGALYELAQSSGRTLNVDRERMLVSDVSERVCGLFGLDPLLTVSEGTLIVTCRHESSSEVVSRLSDRGIAAAVIGTAGGPTRRRLLVSARGRNAAEFVPPRFDPYWAAYSRGLENGWK